MKKVTEKLIFNHMMKFGQYSRLESWAKWYSKVAPVKGKRICTVLLNYKGKNAKLLDFGCGTGMALASMSQTFSSVVGVDIADKEVNAAKEILRKIKSHGKILKYNGKKLPFPNNYFDIVTSIEVIEHVENQNLYLKEAKRVLKPNGILHITTANKWWPIEPHFRLPFLSYLPSTLADFYIRIFGRGDSYQNIKLPSYSEFYTMVSRYFSVKDITIEVLQDYKKYDLEKERGILAKLVGEIIKHTRPISLIIDFLLLRFSLGWLYIGYPKK